MSSCALLHVSIEVLGDSIQCFPFPVSISVLWQQPLCGGHWFSWPGEQVKSIIFAVSGFIYTGSPHRSPDDFITLLQSVVCQTELSKRCSPTPTLSAREWDSTWKQKKSFQCNQYQALKMRPSWFRQLHQREDVLDVSSRQMGLYSGTLNRRRRLNSAYLKQTAG